MASEDTEKPDPAATRRKLEAALQAAKEAAVQAKEILDDELAKEQAAINEEAAKLKKTQDLDRALAKFRANALDRASTSLATVGVITPAAGFLYHTSLLAVLTNQEIVVAVISCLGAAFTLHWCGKQLLTQEYLR